MASVLFRTGSGPTNPSLLPGSPRFPVHLRHGSFSGPLLHLEVNKSRRRINRTTSEPQAITRFRSISAGLHTLPENLFPPSTVAVEEPPVPGAGSGSGRDRNGFDSGRYGGNNNDNDNERNRIGAHYQKLLKSNPNDPLILRNYSKYLHEVEGDTVKAEEYYGRAILANPGDGELLSLYGKLIWDTQRDGERAKCYFDQAVVASPDDCMVMGSFAQFMWEAEEDEDEEESGSKVSVPASQPLVAVF